MSWPNQYGANTSDGYANGGFSTAYSLRARDRGNDDDTSSSVDNRSLRTLPVRPPAWDRRGPGSAGYGNLPDHGDSSNYDPYRDPPNMSSRKPSDMSSKSVAASHENPYANVSSNTYTTNLSSFQSRYDMSPEDQPPAISRIVNKEPLQEGRASPQLRWDRGRAPEAGPVRRPGVYGDGSKRIDQVLQTIQKDWRFMTEERCIPVQIALQFMDDSSLGLASKYANFRDLHGQLQAALRQIVNEQHQGFNSSIGRYHALQASLSISQAKIRQLKDNLSSAKASLDTTRPELIHLAKTSQDYDDMLLMLSSIEQLQAIPTKLEARISEKRFLSAVELLQDALRSMRKDGMDDISALRELRVYLSRQELSLTDILIEELHNHLYLKSPYCEDRWKQHASQRVKGVAQIKANTIAGRQLYQFLDQLDTDNVMRDDPTNNPEANTFSYIHLIVESLNMLGKLDVAVDTLAQRLPVELFRLVEKCSNEVDQRYPAASRSGKEFDNPLFNVSSVLSPQSIILNDLFGTVFARFEAIAEAHRVLHEVISGITKREGTRGSGALTSGFRELWKLYQSEIRSLFHDYLATNDSAYKKHNAVRGSTVFIKVQRDKTKKLFNLRDMDANTSDLISEKESLRSILTYSVPGLVSDSKTADVLSRINTTSSSTPSSSSTSNPTTDGIVTGHKLLLNPSVFNTAILLPPSVGFLNRLKEVVPSSSDISMTTLTSFLDDFLIHVFLPQLDETLVDLCSRVYIELDAFTQDSDWQQFAKRPIFKGTIKFYHLIEAFCRMLDILPHDPAFTQLIITQIVAYYDKCFSWFKASIARTQPHPTSGKRVKLSASLTEDEQLKKILKELWNAPEDARSVLIDQENTNILEAVVDMTVEDADLIMDRRSLTGLCLMINSSRWLASKIKALRFVDVHCKESSKTQSGRFDKERRWTYITSKHQSEPEQVFLPLTEEATVAFDGICESYLCLSSEVLRLVHMEVRSRIIYYMFKFMSRTFLLNQDGNEPDPEVVALNADLIYFDDLFSTCLQSSYQTYITSGLASLLDLGILRWASTRIEAMNMHGSSQMQLNVLVLQQNLKNIEPNAHLSRTAVYFDLFGAGPDALIKRATDEGKALGFQYREMEALLKLCYTLDLKSDRREVVVAAERSLADHLLTLSEVMW